jgi:hypothetical protein
LLADETKQMLALIRGRLLDYSLSPIPFQEFKLGSKRRDLVNL